MDQAIAKLGSGAVDFDVFFPTSDRISRLTFGKVIQPLNHEYIPNLKNVWPALQDPFYDKGSQYTVPYVLFTTGIGWRTDRVKTDPATLSHPYDIFWDESYKGKIYLLDDYREAIAMALLRKGHTDVNTGDPELIEAAKKDLQELSRVNVQLSTEDYSYLPEGQADIHQAWSGKHGLRAVLHGQGRPASVLRYWFQPDGRGPIGNDEMAVLKSGKNPVLAHHFLNFMLDEKNAYENFAQYVGYQPPQIKLNPDRLVADEVVPPNLKSAIVREGDFVNKGYQELELSARGAEPVAERLGRVQRRFVGGRGLGRALSALSLARRGAPRRAGSSSSSSSPSTRSSRSALGTVDPIFQTPVPAGTRSTGIRRVHVRARAALGGAHSATGSSARSPTSSSRRALLADRVPGRVLRRPARGPLQGAVPRRPDRALLHQLPDADARLDQPAEGRTAGSTRCSSWHGIIDPPRAWLDGRASSVIGLVYGYVPFMILPLYAFLDRIDQRLLEAARDRREPVPGVPAGHAPLSVPAILAGSSSSRCRCSATTTRRTCSRARRTRR